MTESQRDRAVTELVWLWVDYPGICAPSSFLEKMVYGLLSKTMRVGESAAEMMARAHADALDIRAALDTLTPKHQRVLWLAYYPGNGPVCTAPNRVRSAYFREGGKHYTPSERLAQAEDAITLAIAAFARVRGIR
jgi:hypothetical protein